MPSIDERVVSMAFENAVFEQRVAQTMGTLSKLDTAIKNIGSTSGLENIEKSADKVTLQGPMSALDKLRAKLSRSGEGAAQGLGEIDKAGNKVTLEGANRAIDKTQGKLDGLSAGKTFTDIEKASNQVELSGLTRALDVVTGKFSMLQGVATVALGNITSQAAMKGANFAKSFAFGPLTQGLQEYQTNLNSIQTILANTEGQQVSGLDAVKAHLDELNTYSDQTIYNFSEMAKNIGTFTAAGVDLDTSTQSIKGIANLAALSGSNSQQASTAMYQLSQAIAAGRVGLQDWNSVVNAGMGGAVFQKALMRTATAMGTVSEGAVKIDKATGKATVNGESFRNSIMAKPGEESWLTSEVLTTTLKNFTGDMKEADLIAQGFSKDQAKAIMQQAKTAKAAATEVKTLSQVFDIARETIGSGWSKTFQLIFGDFEEAKKTFTGLSNFINGFINRANDARNSVLQGWRDLGGREELLKGIQRMFLNIQGWIIPIKNAFREIFPPATAESLFHLTKMFSDLAEKLNTTDEFAVNLQRTFQGVFAVVHIGWEIIKGLAGVLFDLLGIVGKGSGGFLEFTGGIGDFLVSVDDALTKGGLLKGFFEGLSSVLQLPLRMLKAIVSAIASLFGGGTDTRTLVEKRNELQKFGESLTPIERIINNVKDAWQRFVEIFQKGKDFVEPWVDAIADKLSGVADILADTFSGLDIEKVLQGLQTGFIAGIFLVLKKAFGKKGPLAELSGTLGGVNDLIGSFTGKMEAMQSKLHAEALLAIAGAIAVLAAGIYVLSTIDGDKLAKAMTAVAIGLGELMGAMKLMTAGMGKMGILQLPVIAAGMIGLAIAVTILAGAMKIFSTMSWEDIGKGLVGVAGALGSIALGMSMMPPTLPLTAAGLILIGVALNLVAAAIGQFGALKWEEIGKGLFTMVEALGTIALTMGMMPPNLPLTAAGLILLGIALSFIGGAIRKMGELDVATIIKGLTAMTAALAGIATAMWLMPPNMVLIGAGLLIVGAALNAVGNAIAIMGNIGVFGIIKGLTALAGSLAILAVGLTLMQGTLPGSAALMVAAVALGILAPTLAFLGTLKFSTIFKGLAAIALSLGTLALVGGLAAAPLSALGVALLPLAGVFVLTAGAVFLFAKALSLLGGEGGKGVAVMVTALTAFVALIPKLVIDFVKGLLSIVDQLQVLLPKVVVALGVIIDTIIAFVIESAPKLAIAIGVLVDSILQVLLTNTPKLIAAGVKILGDLLNGISQNIGQVTTKVSLIIIKFLAALAAKASALAAGGLKVLVQFLSGIANNLGHVVAAVAKIITTFLNEVTRNIPRIARAGTRMIVTFINSIANNVGKIISAGTNLIIKFLDGIEDAIPRIRRKALSLARTFLNNLAEGMAGLADAGFDAIIKFLNGVADAIRENDNELMDAGANILDAIVDGIVEGAGRMGGLIKKAITGLFGMLPGWAKKILGIHSPSKVFMEIGTLTMMGFEKGIQKHQPAMKKTTETMAGMIPLWTKGILGIRSPSAVMEAIGEDTIKGFANGLRGSQSDIRTAFKDLNDKLTTAMKDARAAIQENQKTLDEERAKAKPDSEAILAAEAAIAKNEQILRRAKAAHNSLTGGMKLMRNELVGLKKDYDLVSRALDAARQALDEAKRARDDAQKSLTDKFNTTPTIDKESEDQVRTYVEALRDQIAATKSYTDTLAKLRALGLDDKTYQKLLDEGLAGKDFAESLLAGGRGAVENLNKLDAQLLAASTTLAKNAATALYQAGVDAAQGLVNGLKAKRKDLQEEMDVLATRLVWAIKRQLKIKSPSQVFVEIGRLTMDGLVRGLGAGGEAAKRTMESTASNLVDATKSALEKVPRALSGVIDMDPTITPVLDLSSVEKDAQKLGDLTNVVPITAAASFGQASAASQEVSAAQAAAASDAAAAAGVSFEFNQTNTSPKALDHIEIYRNTKNQLGQIKDALGLVG